ncbi:hypothetical protein [Mycobacteroides abscessus]|uniref:hypothetical protein n=1 Tax=Mycobacteroides abscessus TaxID=36809 RepID=UPI0009276C32|nr:hypothetical protein [Mycobacteroides abscessus]SIL72120.1 Phage terminase-like protein, large subunit [Mycobacteroides abscessus subsp. abscessus]SKT45363.1 gp8 domain protein [Mycobacteroides abscessus subsp. bolletii]
MTAVIDDETTETPPFLFAEWSCAEGSDPAEFENWKVANPSLGVKGIAPVSALREDFEVKMSIQQFAREHLGMWDDPRMNSVIPFEAWEACKLDDVDDPDGGKRAPVVDVGLLVACVDVAPDQGWASIAIAGKRNDSRSHIEVVAANAGTAWVIPTMQRLLASSKPPAAVVVQAGASAGAFGPELEQIGLKVRYFGTQDIAQATGQFYTDIVDRKLTHLDDESLFDCLAGAAKYPIGKPELEQWGFLRKSVSTDITGIVACCYANRLLTLEDVEETLNAPKKHRLL